MTTAARFQDTTPPATERPASFSYPAGLLALEGGTVHRGALRGAPLPAEGDLIFTTAATGWGEILTDPSYAGQIVVLTHPMAGSYRISAEEMESAAVHARALIVTRLVTPPAGAGWSLEEMLLEAGIPALEEIDTRALTLELRSGAARRAVIRPVDVAGEAISEREAVDQARSCPAWESVDHVAGVSTRGPWVMPPLGERRAGAVLIDYGGQVWLRAALAGRGPEVAVVESSELGAAGYAVSHRDLNDGTVEGLIHASGRIASVQFHPEGAPGPIDAARIFDQALELASA